MDAVFVLLILLVAFALVALVRGCQALEKRP